jgi:hypothetical protein
MKLAHALTVPCAPPRAGHPGSRDLTVECAPVIHDARRYPLLATAIGWLAMLPARLTFSRY